MKKINILGKDFPVLIYQDEDGNLMGEIRELELYAWGQNEEEIIQELESDILDMHEYLNEFEDCNLGKLPLKWKRYLNDVLET